MTHTKKDSKKYEDAVKRFDRQRLHAPGEAVDLVKTLAFAKFDETVELAVRLGVDPRKADQIVRGTVGLPAGTGKAVRVAVFATGPAADEARDAGADVVGLRRPRGAGAGRLPRLRRRHRHPRPDGPGRQLGRVLGPRRPDAEPQDGHRHHRRRPGGPRVQGRTGEYRTDRYGNIHVPIGKVSFDRTALLTNMRAVVEELNRAKPASSKGRYMRGVTVSSTIGPGISSTRPTPPAPSTRSGAATLAGPLAHVPTSRSGGRAVVPCRGQHRTP